MPWRCRRGLRQVRRCMDALYMQNSLRPDRAVFLLKQLALPVKIWFGSNRFDHQSYLHLLNSEWKNCNLPAMQSYCSHSQRRQPGRVVESHLLVLLVLHTAVEILGRQQFLHTTRHPCMAARGRTVRQPSSGGPELPLSTCAAEGGSWGPCGAGPRRRSSGQS